MDLMDALLPVVGVAFEKQLHLSNIVGSRSWSFNMDSGTLTFGDDTTFKVQLLGTEAEDAQTWLWAWANEASGIPGALLKSAHEMRVYGQQHDLKALVDAELPLDETQNGHTLSMLASGLLQANAYYRGPYAGGALFMLIDDPHFPADDRDPVQRILFTFPQLISAISLPDHRQAFVAYVRVHQLNVDDSSDMVQAQAANGQTIEAEFDASNRLINLNARMFQ